MANYSEKLATFAQNLLSLGFKVDDFTEFKFESLIDHSEKCSTEDIVSWYEKLVEQSTMRTERIPLADCSGWSFDKTGSLVHSSGEFFRVEGYRVTGTTTREVSVGWDQPFLTQVGFDGGILGLVRQRHNGIPYYLIEAKEEPGNYKTVQLSTTVQATFSNLKKAHKGTQTRYSHLFLHPEEHPVKVIIDQWTSEDGGRLFNKRNRSMLLEFDEQETLVLVSERYKWVTLYQLKKLILENDAIVAPHIRGILACL